MEDIKKQNINNYDMPDLQRKTHAATLYAGLAMVVAGIALIAAQGAVGSIGLTYLMLIVGVALAGYGSYMLVWRVRRWFYAPTGSPTSCDDIFYLADDYGALRAALESRDTAALKKIARQPDGNVKLRLVHSADKCFAAAQVFRYLPFEFVPESELVVTTDREAGLLIDALK